MSRPTNASLKAEIERLNAFTIKLQVDNKALKESAKRADECNEQASLAADHYKAQRDTLIGYVQGCRQDRYHTRSVPDDKGGGTITQVDRFIEDMKQQFGGRRY